MKWRAAALTAMRPWSRVREALAIIRLPNSYDGLQPE